MKTKNNLYKIQISILSFLLLNWISVFGQKDTTSIEKAKNILSLNYYNIDNRIQYINFKGTLKYKNRAEPMSFRKIRFYLNDESSTDNLLGEFVTNDQGKAQTTIPEKFSTIWKEQPSNKFIAVLDSVDERGELSTDIEIQKAKIKIDTLIENESKKVMASVYSLEDSTWVPVKELEMKLGIQRLSSILPMTEEPLTATDSSGQAVVEFLLDSIPGDVNGFITLVARLEDHELFGNLETHLSVPWGKPTQYVNTEFEQRSLWAKGNKVPLWLNFLAYSIICSVWATLFYLFYKVYKIRKLGLENQ